MEPSEIQRKVIVAPERYVLVNSSAGSGKTYTLAERVKYLLSTGIPADKIVVITFTNAAAETMAERIGNVSGLSCSTVHSYANQLLLQCNINTQQLLDREQYDELFKLVKLHPECVQPIDHLLLDEGQDSTKEQFDFILNVLHPKNWTIFADHRQSIYQFAGAIPQQIIKLMRDPEVTVYNLNENYRNAKNILDSAKNLIRVLGYDYEDLSVSTRDDNFGQVITVDFSPLGISETIRRYVNEGKATYGEWFILTRTNQELEYMYDFLQKRDIPCDTFKKANLDSKGLKEKMKENTVKVLTIHTAKGLEADNVIVIGARFNSPEERCVNYVAATRARNLLVWTRRKRTRKPAAEYWGG